MSGWIALLKRDVMLASRLGGGGFVGVIFFLSLVVLAPFALGPDLNLLARVGPALLWIAALLATLIGLDRLFQADEEDGSLDLMRMGDMPLLLVVLAKGIAHWLTTGLPLTLGWARDQRDSALAPTAGRYTRANVVKQLTEES